MKKSRSEAIRAGDITYDSGRPCNYNHGSVRYTANGACVTCTRAYADRANKAASIAYRAAREARKANESKEVMK